MEYGEKGVTHPETGAGVPVAIEHVAFVRVDVLGLRVPRDDGVFVVLENGRRALRICSMECAANHAVQVFVGVDV